MTARSAEVAGLLVGGERSPGRAQPRLAEGDELVEPAAELAFPAPHDAVALACDDRARVGLEADSRDRELWAVEIAPRRGLGRAGRMPGGTCPPQC